MSEMIFELWEADELRDLPRIAGIMQHKEVLPAGRCRAGSRHAGDCAAEPRQVRLKPAGVAAGQVTINSQFAHL